MSMSDPRNRGTKYGTPERDAYWEARKPQAPVREEGGIHESYRETHPAYATIGVSRVSGNATLFGSDFQHQHYMTIRIYEADLRRSLSGDHTFGNREYIEVALSESQWATFVSTPNVGNGVPCTLAYRASGGDGHVPGIIPAATGRRDQFRGEVEDHIADAIASLREIAETAPTKKLRDKAEHAIRQLSGNLNFVVERFDEHAEETVEKAKTEVVAYIDSAIARAGLQALQGGAPLLTLNDGSEGTAEPME